MADRYIDAKVTCSTIHTLIKALRPDASPGWDGITPGHLIHANTPSLCAKLADIFSVVLSNNVVPKCLTQGTIVPVLKKATSNPNVADSYRPITLGTILSKYCTGCSKLYELVIAPTDWAHESQYGFRLLHVPYLTSIQRMPNLAKPSSLCI